MGMSGRRRDPWPLRLFTRRARPNILLVLCRWRIELTTLGIVTGGLVAGIRAFGIAAVLAGLAGVVTAAAFAVTWPSAQRWVTAAAWCVISPHRVRTCFARCWVINSSGKTPAVLRAIATPEGERVLVWCGAGISFEDIEAVGEPLAAACWAAQVVVTRSDRYAHIIYIDIVRPARRPPGTGYPIDEPDPPDGSNSS
jgi:hypothetical protein